MVNTQIEHFVGSSPAPAHSPIFSVGVFNLLCGSRFMLSKFDCNTLGWKTVPFIFINYIQLAFVSSNRSLVCFYKKTKITFGSSQ